MYYVYLLESQTDKSWYTGYSRDLKQRLLAHQQKSGGQTTRRKSDWKLIYLEGYLMAEDARGRERFLKSGSGRRYIQKQLAHYFGSR